MTEPSATRPRMKPWQIILLALVGMFLVLPMSVLAFQSPLFCLPLAGVGLVLWGYVQPDMSLFGKPLHRMRPAFWTLFGVTAIYAAVATDTADKDALHKRAATILAMDSAHRAAALASADDDLLNAIEAIDPTARASEMARRNAATTNANRGQIDALIKQADALDPEDHDGRLDLWRKIVDLAPGDTAYKAKLAALEDAKSKADAVAQHPEEGVEVVDLDWHKDGFGVVMTLDITLKNTTAYPLKDFTIRCEHFANSGTAMGHNTQTLYETLAPGEKHRFTDLNMGFIQTQAARSNCEVTGASMA